jgi:hypothetical protein
MHSRILQNKIPDLKNALGNCLPRLKRKLVQKSCNMRIPDIADSGKTNVISAEP